MSLSTLTIAPALAHKRPGFSENCSGWTGPTGDVVRRLLQMYFATLALLHRLPASWWTSAGTPTKPSA